MYGRSEYDYILQLTGILSHKSTYMTYIQALVDRQEGRTNEVFE